MNDLKLDPNNSNLPNPMDILAWLILIAMIAIAAYATYLVIKDQKLQSEAFELVDKTFAATWDGDRSLEWYAWNKTHYKLAHKKDEHIQKALATRIREFEQRRKKPNRPRDRYPNGTLAVINPKPTI